MPRMRRTKALVMLAVLVIAGALLWSAHNQRARLVLVSNYEKHGTVAVQVQRFELAWEEPGPVAIQPPQWMARYPVLLESWVWLFRESHQVLDGLVWVFVEARVSSDQPLVPTDIDYRLDYGSYTIGANGSSMTTEPGRPYRVGTRFEVTEGPVPVALEIQVKGEWFRFPIRKG